MMFWVKYISIIYYITRKAIEVTPRVTEGMQEAVPRKVKSISAPPTDPRRSLRLERKRMRKKKKEK